MTDILIGRKQICKYLGVSWGTVQRMIRDRGFPVLIEYGCQPILAKHMAANWVEKRIEKIERRKS